MSRPVTSKSSEKQSIDVVSIGAMAASALIRTSRWLMISVYERCLYCSDQDNSLICIGRHIGRGPFNLLCSSSGTAWPSEKLVSGGYFNAVENNLIHEKTGFVFDTQRASTWNRSLHHACGSCKHLAEDLQWLSARAAESAPPESFGWLIPVLIAGGTRLVGGPENMMTKLLHKNVLEVTGKLSRLSVASISGILETGHAGGLEKLIGLGHGLTPSGDDFLAGFILGLFKMKKEREAAVLARYLYGAAEGKTTAVSLSFYRALSEGWISEAHSTFLDIIGQAEKEQREHALNLVSSFGRTSGWDTLAGLVFGISLILRSLTKTENRLMEAVC